MLAKLNLHEILRSLGQVRPVFHSEADFQHALAWRVQQLFPTAAIRLEYRAPLPGDPLHLDLYARDEGTRIAMELKYKTRALKTTVSDETFELRTHGANPLGRYDFIKDIERVERLVDGGVADLGFAALLTNDNQYWKPVVRPDAGDTAFRLPDGAALPLQFTWGPSFGASTIRGREVPIVLRTAYPIIWFEYSRVTSGTTGRFRGLIVRVDRKA